MSMSMFETTYFSGTEGCSTRIRVPDRYVEGISQLAPHTSSQPQKKGTRNCHRRRRTMPLISAKSGSSVDSCSSSSTVNVLEVWPIDTTKSPGTDSDLRCSSALDLRNWTDPGNRGSIRFGSQGSFQHSFRAMHPPTWF